MQHNGIDSERPTLTILYPDLQDSVVATAGVYAPQHDSHLLIEAMSVTAEVAGRRVLDLCTGSGVLAIAAAQIGARSVTAFDICPRAVGCVRSNAAIAGVAVDARVGSWNAAVAAGPYDLVVSNPPYVPTGPDAHREQIPSAAGPARAWNAGADGRLILDPLCDSAPQLLADGGTMLIVQSEFADALALAAASAQRWTSRRSGYDTAYSVRPGTERPSPVDGAHRDAAGRPARRGARRDPRGEVVSDLEPRLVRIVAIGSGDGPGPGTYRVAGRKRGRIGPLHGRDLYV